VLQDLTGIPLLADLRPCALSPTGWQTRSDRAAVPVDLVVDHSVHIDNYGTKDALDLNMKLEFHATASATSS